MKSTTHRAISVAMIPVLLYTWIAQPVYAALATERMQPAEQRAATVEKLERLFDALEQAAKEIPRDTFDPQAIVNKVGKDPTALFEWVRDNTYLVPYRGTLRGPIGVLMDRLGNSLDRALLLHELLTIAGHEARLARGALSSKQAERVLNESRPIPPGGALPAEAGSGESMDELITEYAEEFQLDPVELGRITRHLMLKQQNMAEEVAQRVEDQTKALLELVGEPEIDIRATERAKAIEALCDHWWVQWKGASGWNEFDSTLPDAKAGDTLVEVAATHQANDIDEELQHLVTIRVIIEKWKDGRLEEEQVLEHILRPSKLFGKRIALTHIPLNWPEDLDLFAEAMPLERLKAVVLEEKEWLPVLTVGSEQIVQSSFTDLGEVKDEPSEKPASPAEDLSRGAGDVFGGIIGTMSGREPEREAGKKTQLTAERIDYFITTPGESSRVISRQIFDLIDPRHRSKSKDLPVPLIKSARLNQAFSLLGETELAIQACSLSPEFLIYRLLSNFISDQAALRELFEYPINKKATSAIQTMSRVTPSLGPGYIFMLAREQLSTVRDEAYLATVNIVNFERKIRTLSDNKEVFYEGFDILDNKVAVALDADNDSFKARIKQGVLDTNLEALIISEEGRPRGNAAEMMWMSAQQDVGWLALRMKEDLYVHKEGVPERTYISPLADVPMEIRANIEEDLEKGYLVIIPDNFVTKDTMADTGWWRVDTSNGTTLGFGVHGDGGAFVESAIVRKWAVWAVGGLRYYYCVHRECSEAITSREFDICVLKCMIKGVVFGIAAYGLTVTRFKELAAVIMGWDIMDDVIEDLYDLIDAL